jgi:DNA-binding HxlR family transcriptional regulator
MSKPTDSEILDVVLVRGPINTYVVRNWLGTQFKGIKTDYVLRRLKKLEKAGRVRRHPTAYAVQICWAIAAPKESK